MTNSAPLPFWIIKKEQEKQNEDKREQIYLPIYNPPESLPKNKEKEENSYKITIYI